MRQRRTSPLVGAALPAFGGPRLPLQVVKPLASLPALQELLALSRACVIRKLLRMKQHKITQDVTRFGLPGTMFPKAARQVIADANVAPAIPARLQEVQDHAHRVPRKAIGGGDGIRTHDPLHAMQVLSQLSYSPTGRGGQIRTADLLAPIQARCQTALRPAAPPCTARKPACQGSWQGWQDLNPRPTVLETAALPD